MLLRAVVKPHYIDGARGVQTKMAKTSQSLMSTFLGLALLQHLLS
jgi:hypothetical protein